MLKFRNPSYDEMLKLMMKPRLEDPPPINKKPLDEEIVKQIVSRLPEIVKDNEEEESGNALLIHENPPEEPKRTNIIKANLDFESLISETPRESNVSPLEVLNVNKIQEKSRNPLVKVIFSRRIIPLCSEEESRKFLMGKNVLSNPKISFNSQWKGTSILELEPSENLKYSTRYDITIPKGTKTYLQNEDALSKDFNFSIETKTLGVSGFQVFKMFKSPIFLLEFNQAFAPENIIKRVLLIRVEECVDQEKEKIKVNHLVNQKFKLLTFEEVGKMKSEFHEKISEVEKICPPKFFDRLETLKKSIERRKEEEEEEEDGEEGEKKKDTKSSEENHHFMIFTTSTPLLPNTNYRLHVPKGLPSLEGPLVSDETFKRTFKTCQESFTLLKEIPKYSFPHSDTMSYFTTSQTYRAYFTLPVDPRIHNLNDYIVVDEAIPFPEKLKFYTQLDCVLITRKHEDKVDVPPGVYKITFKKGLKSIIGTELLQDEILEVKVIKDEKRGNRGRPMFRMNHEYSNKRVFLCPDEVYHKPVEIAVKKFESFSIEVYQVKASDFQFSPLGELHEVREKEYSLGEYMCGLGKKVHMEEVKVTYDDDGDDIETPKTFTYDFTKFFEAGPKGRPLGHIVVLARPSQDIIREGKVLTKKNSFLKKTWIGFSRIHVDVFSSLTRNQSVMVTNNRSEVIQTPILEYVYYEETRRGDHNIYTPKTCHVSVVDNIKKTETEGIIDFSLPFSRKVYSTSNLIVRHGKDETFVTNLSKCKMTREILWNVFDDRKIYQPGEKISIKGYIREKFTTIGGQIIERVPQKIKTVKFVAKYRHRDAFESGSRKIHVDSGSFCIVFKIPEHARFLGEAEVVIILVEEEEKEEVRDPWGFSFGKKKIVKKRKKKKKRRSDYSYTHTFKLEQFSRPEVFFTIDFLNPRGDKDGYDKKEIRRFVQSEDIFVRGKGEFFSGECVSEKPTKWKIKMEKCRHIPRNFRRFRFACDLSDASEDNNMRYFRRGSLSKRERAKIEEKERSGTTNQTGEDVFIVESDRGNGRPFHLNMRCEMFTGINDIVFSETSCKVFASDLYPGLDVKKRIVGVGENLPIDVVILDPRSDKAVGAGVEYTIKLTMRQEKKKKKSDGDENDKNDDDDDGKEEEKKPKVSVFTFKTGDEDINQPEIKLKESGYYDIELFTKDKSDQIVSVKSFIIVAIPYEEDEVEVEGEEEEEGKKPKLKNWISLFSLEDNNSR